MSPKTSPPQDWVSPTYHLPTPTLDLDFRISCQLNPILRVGEGPWGQRNWISFKGGEWTAKWGRGTIEVSQNANAFPKSHKSIRNQKILREGSHISYTTSSFHPSSLPNTVLPPPARRPRLPTRAPRHPAHLRLHQLPAPHQRRSPSFHHRANDGLANGPARSDAAAIRSRASGRRGSERVFVPAVD